MCIFGDSPSLMQHFVMANILQRLAPTALLKDDYIVREPLDATA